MDTCIWDEVCICIIGKKELVTELNIIEQGKPITDKLLAKEHGTVELNTLLPFSTMQGTATTLRGYHASMHRTVVEPGAATLQHYTLYTLQCTIQAGAN